MVSNIKLLSFSPPQNPAKIKQKFIMEDGTEFTLHQMQWHHRVNQRRLKLWLCPSCHYKWRGHKRLHWEGRKPTKCPKCGKYGDIQQIKKG